MTTDVVKGTDLIPLVSQNDQAFTEEIEQEIISRVGDTAQVARADPISGKDAFLFPFEHFVRCVVFLGGVIEPAINVLDVL